MSPNTPNRIRGAHQWVALTVHGKNLDPRATMSYQQQIQQYPKLVQ